MRLRGLFRLLFLYDVAESINLAKLRDLLGDLYDSMVDRFNETRSFVLELLVTILAVFDVIFLFRGR